MAGMPVIALCLGTELCIITTDCIPVGSKWCMPASSSSLGR